MDKIKASQWAIDFAGRVIAGCKIISLIDFGKSAAVFEATLDGTKVALKIFDDEIIERYGDKAQLKRISRELTLVGRSHPNMVKIINGGKDPATNNHFIVMEFLDGPNLAKCLRQIPLGNVPQLIEQLSSCCRYLETLELVHRDIKPANIVVTGNFTKLVLLDFGVMKPVGEVGVTDIEGIQMFVGTLQYSSPEFLLREEEDTVEGWRALSLYQIGAVLHDLIMREPLFREYTEPYARLVNAVQFDIPKIQNEKVAPYLINACRAALVKDPKTRLSLVGWSAFTRPTTSDVGLLAKERVTQRSLLAEAMVSPEQTTSNATSDLIDAVINLIKVEAKRIRNGNTTAFPPVIAARMPPDAHKVKIKFRATDRKLLGSDLSLEIGVAVLDEVSQAISIAISAWLGPQASRPDGSTPVLAYRGLFVPGSISEILENAMYVAMDRAQATFENDGEVLELSDLEVKS